MEERPKTPSAVSRSLQACAPSKRHYSHVDPASCDAGQDRVTYSTRLTARSTTRIPFRSDARLYARLCGACSPRVFPAELLLRPKPGPFSGPTVARVSGTTAHFELARPPAVCLAARHGGRTRYVRPTSATHCLDYEHPRIVSYRHLFEACASPFAAELALGDKETGGPGVSRRPVRFGKLVRVGARRLTPCALD
jgi:hypothetical protein